MKVKKVRDNDTQENMISVVGITKKEKEYISALIGLLKDLNIDYGFIEVFIKKKVGWRLEYPYVKLKNFFYYLKREKMI